MYKAVCVTCGKEYYSSSKEHLQNSSCDHCTGRLMVLDTNDTCAGCGKYIGDASGQLCPNCNPQNDDFVNGFVAGFGAGFKEGELTGLKTAKVDIDGLIKKNNAIDKLLNDIKFARGMA